MSQTVDGTSSSSLLGGNASTPMKLYFRAESLNGGDTLVKRNAYVVVCGVQYSNVHLLDPSLPKKERLTELGRTEVILNDNAPTWTKTVALDFVFETRQDLVLKVFEEENLGDGGNTLLGHIRCELGNIIGAKACTKTMSLYPSNSQLHVTAAEVCIGGNDILRLQFAGSSLQRRNLFDGYSNTYITIGRYFSANDTVFPVWRSKTVVGSLEPLWEPVPPIRLSALTGTDVSEKTVYLEVMQANSIKGDTSMGRMTLSVNEILHASGSATIKFPLRKEEKAHKDYGNVLVREATLQPMPSFTEYLKCGHQLNLAICIDFTGSNGDCRHPKSLHYLPESLAAAIASQAAEDYGEGLDDNEEQEDDGDEQQQQQQEHKSESSQDDSNTEKEEEENDAPYISVVGEDDTSSPNASTPNEKEKSSNPNTSPKMMMETTTTTSINNHESSTLSIPLGEEDQPVRTRSRSAAFRGASQIGEMGNEYIEAIASVGEILMQYDTDKMVPVYGFGAVLPNQKTASHFFNLTMNPKNAYVRHITGVLEAYRKGLPQLKMAGPTNFSPCITQVTKAAREAAKDNVYTVLLMLTDGDITDMQATIDAVVDADDAPLSIIIVGVGTDCDFENMQELDCDGAFLTSSKGKLSRRDAVQFVAMAEFKRKSLGTLAAEVLREVPDQFREYARLVDLPPPRR